MDKKKWFLNGGRGSGRTLRLLCEVYENKIADLEKENAELKEKLKPENCLKLLAKEGYIKFTSEQLTKAKELLKRCYENYIYLEPLRSEIKQFLKESE